MVTCWKSSRGRTVAVAGSPNTRKRGRAEFLAKKNEKTSSREDMSGITKVALSVFGAAWFLLVARRLLRHGLAWQPMPIACRLLLAVAAAPFALWRR
jgi:hypothetical protein